jgi:hypothetical protein
MDFKECFSKLHKIIYFYCPLLVQYLFQTPFKAVFKTHDIIIIVIRGAAALTNLGRQGSRRWQSFPTAPDGTGLTCGQHIEFHSCSFSFPNRTITSLFM